jgi:hypothetical protein
LLSHRKARVFVVFKIEVRAFIDDLLKLLLVLGGFKVIRAGNLLVFAPRLVWRKVHEAVPVLRPVRAQTLICKFVHPERVFLVTVNET